MSRIFSDDGAAMRLRILCDLIADISEEIARSDLNNPDLETLPRDLDDMLRLRGDLTDGIHPRGIADIAIDDCRDIDIQDISISEDLI